MPPVNTKEKSKRERERDEREIAEREKREQTERDAAQAAKLEWERLEKERAENERREKERQDLLKQQKDDSKLFDQSTTGVTRHNSILTGGNEMAAPAPAAPPAAVKSEPVKNEGVPASEVLKSINSVPADRYQIRRDIALGGQGACKVAFDQLAEREVILKTSSPQGGWNGERIIKEARYAAKLNHPNVSRLLELGSFGKDQVFMTMPYIEGSSLDQVLKKISDAGIPGLTGYAMTTVAELFDKICAGVEHAHASGLLHLDLKPQNVVVGSKGEVVVVDWGIAQPINASEWPKRYASTEGSAAPSLNTTMVGMVAGDPNVRAVGTPTYLSPEQWAGDPGTFTERTDVYGLGGVLFYLLTGTAPNQIQRPTDLDPYFRHSPVPAPSDYTRRRVPPELEALCMKCLARDPAQRYPSVFHVRHILKSWLSRPEMWELYRASY
ncbi:MAG TPA: protein kinase [Planctomycetota bacterium]|nr:protein kinase [Planctomycetota bacterium]